MRIHTMKLHVADELYFIISFDAFQTLMEGKGGKATAEGMELLREDVEKLKEQLKISGDGSYPCICAHAHNILSWFFTRVNVIFIF